MWKITAIIFSFIFVVSIAYSMLQIHVVGLFKDKAVVVIDGKRRMLSKGERSPEGVKLLAANNKSALFEYAGHKFEHGLSSHINTRYQQFVPKDKSVKIPLNEQGQYLTKLSVYGHTIAVLIDTGANTFSLNSRQAKQLGIDYLSGQKTEVNTASGVAMGYTIMLDEVVLAGIKVKQVMTTVLDGTEPKIALVGMSILKQLNMRFDDDTNILEFSD